MNKIYKILFPFFAMLLIAGCSSDDDNKDVQTLQIIKSDTEYASSGGKGTIEVSTIEAVTATSNQSWCTPSISGNIINLDVTQNTDINGRHAVITVKSGSETAIVTITQLGTTFIIDNSVIQLPTTGGSGDIKFESENAITVKIDPEDTWLSYELKEGTITFTATKTKTVRTAIVEVTSGILKKTVKIEQNIIQFDYEDYLGSYKFTYTNDFLEQDEMIVTLTEKEKGVSYTMDGPNFNYPFQVNYRESDGCLEVRPHLLEKDVVNGPPFGDGSTYDVYLGLWGTESSYTPVTNNPAVSLKGVLDLSSGTPTVIFTDGGGWEYGKVDAICFSFFDENNLYQGDYYGSTFLATVFDIVMVKQ